MSMGILAPVTRITPARAITQFNFCWTANECCGPFYFYDSLTVLLVSTSQVSQR